jgi:predicted ester cyclase
MSEENIAASRRIFDEAWNQGNLDVIDEVCARRFTNHDPIMGDSNREAVKELIAGYRAAFPDLEITINDIMASGDEVAMRWTAVGTFESELMGQEPTGERGDPVEGIAIDRFEGDKMVESWAQWDTLRFMKNIGAIPEEAATPAG